MHIQQPAHAIHPPASYQIKFVVALDLDTCPYSNWMG